MGILDAYQDSADTALRMMATQPLTPEPVTPKHSTWSAPFRAVAAGAAEVAGNVMDTAGAFGQVAAAAGGLTPGFDPKYDKNPRSELQRINQRVDQFQTAEAFDKLKTEGINWRTDEAQQAYKFGADLRPDPLTAGTAENIVFGLTKGLTKAIGAAATLGPVGGAAAFGVSEGLTTAEDLANQGVDQQTRSKVGAVTGAIGGAGAVLPVAGKTLATTVGLVAGKTLATALRVMATQPLTPEPVTPKHSTWSAPFRAVAAGAAEVAGNVMDTAGAFGQVAAAAGGLTPGFDPKYDKNPRSELQRINQRVDQFQTAEAFDKLKTEGINWRTDEAQQAYKFGADLRPDPLTAGTAENLVFSLTKGLTKAIGAAVALGPVGGAAAFGVSEGLTTAEDLANQGVDQQTRSKVGAVTGAMSAAVVVLPVAGKTLAQTAGLVLVGGPASFMAQQQATRSILENANYGEIAKQYDPLDPVGLTVATLLPAGFAAYAKRGGFAQHAGPTATPEAVDAAMVQNLTVARDDHSSSINRIWLKPIDDSFIDDPFNVDPNSRAYTIGTVQAIDEAINLVGEKRFSELALPRSEKQATDTLYFDQAQRVEMVGRKIVDFYEKNPPPKFDEAPPTAPLPAVKDSLTTQTDAAKPATQDIAPDAYRARVEQLATEQPDLVARLDDAGQPVRLADELAAVRKAAQEGTDTEFGALDAPLLKVAAECALATGTAAL